MIFTPRPAFGITSLVAACDYAVAQEVRPRILQLWTAKMRHSRVRHRASTTSDTFPVAQWHRDPDRDNGTHSLSDNCLRSIHPMMIEPDVFAIV
jgi:hypothetical protein